MQTLLLLKLYLLSCFSGFPFSNNILSLIEFFFSLTLEFFLIHFGLWNVDVLFIFRKYFFLIWVIFYFLTKKNSFFLLKGLTKKKLYSTTINHFGSKNAKGSNEFWIFITELQHNKNLFFRWCQLATKDLKTGTTP